MVLKVFRNSGELERTHVHMVLTIPHMLMLKNIIYKYSCYYYCVQYATQYILYNILLLYINMGHTVYTCILYILFILHCSSCAFYIIVHFKHFFYFLPTLCTTCIVRRYCNANDIQCTMVLLHKKTSKISCSNFVTSLTIITNT